MGKRNRGLRKQNPRKGCTTGDTKKKAEEACGLVTEAAAGRVLPTCGDMLR